MLLTKEKAKTNLAGLLAKFERELAAHQIREYNEEAAKTAFIQPLLKDVLGWDVNERNEVSPEEKISRGRVDYGLKIEGKTRIFVEAKPPRAELDKHIDQAVRYGYNRKGVPFVLLTDFERIKLFDVTVKPDIRNPLKGLKLDLELGQYLDKFDQLWQLSKESVAAGKLDELLRVKPKDRLPVDKAILEDLKRWREILAKDIFKNNPELFHSGDSEKDANYLREITQKILDRITFMRSCEDRGLYHGRTLKEIFGERTDAVGIGTMVFLKKEFENYNLFFDSDLFSPRDWESKLAVDFKVMREIVLETYNPYQFDVIPIEVLGNIYEQYLGYTIRLTEHQVKYDLKPEVRKAGGVYYTPEYIVNYIVKNTVGKMLQELPEGKAKKLRILDPACGSGSFLIRAYEEMLRYYQDQKTKKVKPKAGQKKLELPEEKLRLTISEKREILLTHIFGVDIDDQAVEVTKLSLMLKMLDGEQGTPVGRGVLPMLDKNIKCGNSLISGNALELHKYFGEDWYKVKPFNWEDEFPQIMKDEGGFGVVIGNPPYVRPHRLDSNIKSYFWSSYKTFVKKSDLYACFIEKSVYWLKVKGVYGQIISDGWLRLDSFEKLRKLLLDQTLLRIIIDFNDDVFESSNVKTAILLFSKEKPIASALYAARTSAKRDLNKLDFNKIRQSLFKSTYKNIFDLSLSESAKDLKDKISKQGKSLLEAFDVSFGLKTGDDSKFIHDKKRGNEYKPLLRGENIHRYTYKYCGEFVWYVPLMMIKNKKTARPGNRQRFEQPKILIRDTSEMLQGTFDNRKFYVKDVLIITAKEGDSFKLKFLLGLINSALMRYFYGTSFPTLHVQRDELASLPIRFPKVSDPSEVKIYRDLADMVDAILNLNRKNQAGKGNEKDQIQRQIDKTDREIDDLVYKLYGITEEERRIIEGDTSKP